MTNKLPVVGKRYKATDSNKLITSKNHILTCDEIFPTTVILDKAASYICWPISCFFEDFEELPEDKAETKPETQSHISELSPEVKKAMEELDKELDRWMPTEDKEEYQLTSKAEKLLNALDKQFMSKEEVKIDTSSGSCLSDTRESIWKPDREITQTELMESISAKKVILHPTKPVHLQIWDFINDYEKLKERVRKLEEKCRKS